MPNPTPARQVHTLRLLHRGVLAVLGAAAIGVFAASSSLAVAPPGTVTVDTDGCNFTVHIDLDQSWPVVTWKVKVFDGDNWKDGETLIKDSAENDADGKIDAGPYTLPEGHYNVAVDNETTIDGSAIVVDFTLSCQAVAPATPTPTPTGEELPATGTPTPKPHSTGQEEAATGNGGAVGGISATPPPTDTGVGTSAPASGTSWLVLAIIGAASIATFTISTRRFGAVRARKRSSR